MTRHFCLDIGSARGLEAPHAATGNSLAGSLQIVGGGLGGIYTQLLNEGAAS